ncbi:MAG: SUMF1/EgtB/PvdO family nonheme iron enzyme [Desulfobacteraceae bacterium]|nr:SUMF1/EgtB/PvdO family nonheme iron enzyme [Desulfobacteraceae bacterium]
MNSDKLQSTTNIWPQYPYKGLSYYEPQDRPIFAGRDQELISFSYVLANFSKRIVILQGKTGCGKTSFLRANVIPFLEKHEHGFQFLKSEETEQKKALFVRSTDAPLTTMSDALFDFLSKKVEIKAPGGYETLNLPKALLGHTQQKNFIENTSKNPEQMFEVLSAVSDILPRTLVIVIDQAEEVLTIKHGKQGDAARSLFFQFLSFFSRAEIDIKILISIRSDHFGEFHNTIRQYQVHIPSVDDYMLKEFEEDDLIRAITRPTSLEDYEGHGSPKDQYRFSYETNLPEIIAHDIIKATPMGGLLPVMQIVCFRLYSATKEQSKDDEELRITKNDYKKFGKVEGRVAAHLDEVLKNYCRKNGINPSEIKFEVYRWKNVLLNLVKTQAEGSVTTNLETEENLFEEALKEKCVLDFKNLMIFLCDDRQRIIRKSEVVNETGLNVTYYSLGHDAIGLALKSPEHSLPIRGEKKKLRCLHLSDLYLRDKDSAGIFSQDVITASMLRTISELENKPDFIVITGDLTYSGKPEEFEVARIFCDELLKTAGLAQKRLYLVPGNHDVDRREVKSTHIKSFYHFDNEDDVTEILTDADFFSILIRKFSGFSAFAEKTAGRKLFDETRYWFAETLSLGENRINLIGLNSCLFAGYDGDDRQNLALGLYQVENALNELCEDAFISIGFFHHPFSCFHPADKVCRNLLTNRLDLILTGHLHEPDSSFIRNAAEKAVIISAGTFYEKHESRNSFSMVEIDTEIGRSRIQFYKYLPKHNLWKKDMDVNPDEDDGTFSFIVRGSRYPTSKPDKPDMKSLRLTRIVYCRLLIKTLQHLPLRGLDRDESDPSGNRNRLELDRVYVDLDTKTPVGFAEAEKKQQLHEDDILWPDFDEKQKTRPLSALEATARNRHLVILGDPGSGKSTFVNHLTLCLAAHNTDNTEACFADQLSWPENETDITPIPVILRDFARQIQGSEKAEVKQLWEFIRERMKSQNLDFAGDALEDALDRGKAIVLFDGLDEIPTQEKRTFVRDAVTAFARRYEKSRFIVTCRVLSYQNPDWKLDEKDFPVFELAPFDENKIDAFIGAWYEDLLRLNVIKTADEKNILARRLRDAVGRPDLWRLAPNPLLLTVMALVHTHKGRLPDARALLYEETTDILLWRWEHVKTVGEKSLPRLQELLLEAGRADVDLKKLLWGLAFEVHGKSEGKGGELADIKEWELEKALAALHPKKSKDWAGQVITTIKMRAGLLLEREPEVYSFPHRTFQEYLAGACLSSQADFAKQASALVETGNFWREAVLLAVGRLVYLSGDSDRVLVLANELCPAVTGDNEAAWRKVWMAGEVLAEIGTIRLDDSNLGKELSIRIKERLVELLEKGRLEPKERVSAGNALGRLGDIRFNPNLFYLPNDKELGFVRVPPGKFKMGSDKNRDKYAGVNEQLHTVELSEYYIAKYPVTVGQFNVFMQDNGYQSDEMWYSWNKFDNYPVVYVSWNDTVKYCEWLTEKFREKGYDWKIKLPTEAQWEKTARGDDGNIYPWGDEFDTEKLNCYETKIGSTSPVGCFPKGNSLYGHSDMSGNIWEWCLDSCDWNDNWNVVTDTYKDGIVDPFNEWGSNRVIRGGSWGYDAQGCRSAFRGRLAPDNRNGLVGFRLSREV